LRAPGAGGYGDAAQRDGARLHDDVVNGYVSPAAAATEYGHADRASLACPDCGRG
jgi:N-methylhydantoinase B/oxoprolinase/acetone carboxylase alpha subunit